MTTSESSNCPKCGSAIPGDAPAGLCPKCVLEGAAATPRLTATGNAAKLPPSVPEIAPHFPDLEILELLGAGGMGAVYKARQPQLDRFVALKILSHELAPDPAFVERFNREARVLARLSHPNIVAVFDFGTAGPHCYLVMEFVDGVNLRQAMQAARFTPAESLAMVEEICAALKFAHEEGILHRDIKPENILIDSKGRVKIADFGIAKLLGAGEPADVTLTLRGSILGSPHYMAPEQIETPDDVDQRADIYSLGVVFYEMLTGELPLGRFALPSEKAAMDARIDDIVLRTLEKERQARFQSADEVMTQVGAVAQAPAAPAPATQPTATSDANPTARFSLASAVLTGVSLVVIVAGVILTNSLSYKLATLLITLTLLLAGIPGIIGLIFGIVALGDIRRSGGRKTGLGMALFGTTAWPILLMPLSASLLGMAPMPGSQGPSIPAFVLPIGALLTMLSAGYVLFRTLRRWAGGVESDDGGRDFPGMGRGLILSVLIALAGPILLVIAPRFLPDSGDGMSRGERAAQQMMRETDEAMAEHMREIERIESSMTVMESSSSDDGVNWRLGEPEVRLPVMLNAGLFAFFKVVKREADGSEEVIEIGEAGVDAESGETQKSFLIKLGTTLKPHDTKGAIQELVIVRTGTHSYSNRTNQDLRGWSFNTEQPAGLTLSSPGRSEIHLAAHRVVGEDGVPRLGSLSLHVVVTPLKE